MTKTVLKDQSLEHLLARELRALDEQTAHDRDAEFHSALEQLLADFELNATDAARILLSDSVNTEDPSAGVTESPKDSAQQRRRKTTTRPKVYRNPYTREVLKTGSFNHHTLNEWRKRHGRLTVQTWRIK